MKQKYIDMETNIKKQLDQYYYNIRDSEIKVKNKIDYITNNTITDLESIENTSTCKTLWDSLSEEIPDKIKPLFHKLTEVFSNKGFLPDKNDKIVDLYQNDKIMYQLKLMKDKVLVYNNILSIEVNKKNVDDSINYINVFLA